MSNIAHDTAVLEQLKRLADGLKSFADATDASTARSDASYQDLLAQVNRLATGIESFRDASDASSAAASTYQLQLVQVLQNMNKQLELMIASIKAASGQSIAPQRSDTQRIEVHVSYPEQYNLYYPPRGTYR